MSRALLSTIVAGSVAVIGTAFAHGLFTQNLLRDPLLVKLLPDERPKPPRVYEESEPELVKDWGIRYPEGSGTGGGQDSFRPLGPPLLPRYSRQEQIWDEDQGIYVDFHPPAPRRPPDDDELLYWFKVYSRRQTPSKNERPRIQIEFLSRTLINFMRSVLGNVSAFNRRPIVGIHELFPHRDTFLEWVQRLDFPALQRLDFKSKQEMATSLGIPDATADDMDEMLLLKHLESVSRQLGVLVTCLKKEFEPIEAEMAMFLAHGHITFDLVGYIYKQGVKLLLEDDYTKDKIAMRMTSSNYSATSGMQGTKMFNINGTGYRWNGFEYEKVPYYRSVSAWEGTKALSSLPWSVLTTEDEQELVERGRVYCQYSGIFHIFNEGPLGGQGRAMVDSTSQQSSLYSANQSFDWAGPPPQPDNNHWGAPPRRPKRRRRRAPPPPPVDDDWGDDPYPADQVVAPDPDPAVLDAVLTELPEEDLYLLPPTVQGFMLREKEWVEMRVLSLSPVQFDRNAWDHLVLDPNTKLLIRSLVEVTRKGSAQGLVQDVITGKGGGLVAILHGKPGTGKTLTAEAVAEQLERPLYVVGSEELSFDASTLEGNMKMILGRAAKWDAVLLIDEADVFLEQRSLHELQRNAVVSVALRLLEYHAGVLFLTTNRIKAFDEAFLSRFSIGIKYPDLDQISRLKIWRSFLRMAEVEIVENESDPSATAKDGKSKISLKDLETLAEKPFNGRSIKNLVRTSQALALANNEPLAIEHLRIVASTSEQFLHDFDSEVRVLEG